LAAYEDSDVPAEDYLDPSVVEAACLAHDLGHPPFGHLTEELLDEKVREKTSPDDNSDEDDSNEETESEDAPSSDGSPEEVVDEEGEEKDPTIGYEGNAQSFRIVTKLVPSGEEYLGLDLTRATLNAIQKYPWERDADIDNGEDTDDKWGYYPTEQRYFNFARASLDTPHERTLEAEIMDYADDLTYAIHDVDDFYRDGLIPLDKLLREAADLVDPQDRTVKEVDIDVAVKKAEGTDLKAFEDYVLDESDVRINTGDVIRFFIELVLDVPNVTDHLFSPYEGTEDEQRTLNQFVSSMIARYLEAVQETAADRENIYLAHSEETETPILEIDPKFSREIGILKQLTFYHVISNPTLAAQQHGQENIIDELFEMLYDESEPEDILSSAIPAPYRDQLGELDDQGDPERARIIADMIAAMTEPQAVTLHKRLVGHSPGSLQDEIIR
jgi:dGTPase